MVKENKHYYSKETPRAGKAIRITERDKDGRPLGEYDGYWRPELGLIYLYPAKGSWIYGRLLKKKINERELKIC